MSRLPVDSAGFAVQIARLYPDANQALAIGATATTSTALNSDIVRVNSDISINILFGEAGDGPAATTDARVPADTVEYFQIVPGQLLHVITTTGTDVGQLGTLWVSEIV